MFCIKLSDMARDDIMHAMFLLSYYHVSAQLFSDGDDPDSTYMVVEGPAAIMENNEVVDNVGMAEMAFQMNHRQVGFICPHCENDDDNEEKTCGHLTFTTRIEDSLFTD